MSKDEKVVGLFAMAGGQGSAVDEDGLIIG